MQQRLLPEFQCLVGSKVICLNSCARARGESLEARLLAKVMHKLATLWSLSMSNEDKDLQGFKCHAPGCYNCGHYQ